MNLSLYQGLRKGFFELVSVLFGDIQYPPGEALKDAAIASASVVGNGGCVNSLANLELDDDLEVVTENLDESKLAFLSLTG